VSSVKIVARLGRTFHVGVRGITFIRLPRNLMTFLNWRVSCTTSQMMSCTTSQVKDILYYVTNEGCTVLRHKWRMSCTTSQMKDVLYYVANEGCPVLRHKWHQVQHFFIFCALLLNVWLRVLCSEVVYPCCVFPWSPYKFPAVPLPPRNTGSTFNPLNAELNPICHLLALLGAHNIFHISGLRVKLSTTMLFNFLSYQAILFGTSHRQQWDSILQLTPAAWE